MYGFIGSLTFNKTNETALFCEPHSGAGALIQNELYFEDFKIKRLSVDKFAKDKVFYNDADVIIVVEGVIYNFNELSAQYGIHDRGLLLKTMYSTLSVHEVLIQLNGYYSGVIFDKREKRLFLLTDRITYKPVWYAQMEGTLFFSSDIHWLYMTVIENTGSLKMDRDGIYCLLNYGYMLGDITPVQGVRKLLAGNYAECINETVKLNLYYTVPDAKEESLTSSQEYNKYLEKIDNAFVQAVKNVYSKDDEYGYSHCITLSGGLDSRLVLLTALRLGYNSLCLTMGESGCADIRIASKICHDYKLEHLIYELDNGVFLCDIDHAIEANGATILYPGFAHTYRMKSLINFSGFGSIHSGDLGDLVLGGSLVGNEKKIDITSAMYGSNYLDGFSGKFKNDELTRYTDSFHFNYYNRGLNSAGNGCFAAHFYTECSSPFIDKSLCDLMFSVPRDLIKEHKIYFDYMSKYLPEACNYIWEHTGCKPGAGKIKRYIVRWKQRIKFRIFKQTVSMNPFEKWYRENPTIKQYFDEIFNDSDEIKKGDIELYNDLCTRFHSSRVMDKSLACFVVAFIKKYNIQL